MACEVHGAGEVTKTLPVGSDAARRHRGGGEEARFLAHVTVGEGPLSLAAGAVAAPAEAPAWRGRSVRGILAPGRVPLAPRQVAGSRGAGRPREVSARVPERAPSRRRRSPTGRDTAKRVHGRRRPRWGRVGTGGDGRTGRPPGGDAAAKRPRGSARATVAKTAGSPRHDHCLLPICMAGLDRSVFAWLVLRDSSVIHDDDDDLCSSLPSMRACGRRPRTQRSAPPGLPTMAHPPVSRQRGVHGVDSMSRYIRIQAAALAVARRWQPSARHDHTSTPTPTQGGRRSCRWPLPATAAPSRTAPAGGVIRGGTDSGATVPKYAAWPRHQLDRTPHPTGTHDRHAMGSRTVRCRATTGVPMQADESETDGERSAERQQHTHFRRGSTR